MLNGTMCAVTRVICVLLELNQQEDGVKVPEAIKQWMPESEFRTTFLWKKQRVHFFSLSLLQSTATSSRS